MALECTVDGYVGMVTQMMELILIFVSWGVQTLVAILPENLGKSAKYAYAFLTGFASWIGYALAGVNYFALEYGFGDIMCTVFGYFAYVIEALHFLVDFSGAPE